MDENKYQSDKELLNIFLKEELSGYEESDIMWEPEGEYYFVIGQTEDGKTYRIHVPVHYKEYCDYAIGRVTDRAEATYRI